MDQPPQSWEGLPRRRDDLAKAQAGMTRPEIVWRERKIGERVPGEAGFETGRRLTHEGIEITTGGPDRHRIALQSDYSRVDAAI